MPSGGHVCSVPALCCKAQDGQLGELRAAWGRYPATKDGPTSSVPEPISADGEEGWPQGHSPRLGTVLRSYRGIAVGAPLLHPHPKSITALTGCHCSKVRGTGFTTGKTIQEWVGSFQTTLAGDIYSPNNRPWSEK